MSYVYQSARPKSAPALFASGQVYSTHAEIAFVNGLGNWAESRKSRMDLLRGYRRAMERRSNWGTVCAATVRAAVDAAIAAEVAS
jgi:hypothetical protein